MLRDADLVDRSRVVMEKPFGTDLKSAVELNRRVHETFSEDQIFRIDHFLGKEPALNILAFRFANGLFEPIWNRNFIDHVQIDVPEVLGLDNRADFYEATGAYKDMVVTHLFQIMAFVAMEPPTALEPRAISEEKNKVFRSLRPIETVGRRARPVHGLPEERGCRADSETETFIALQGRDRQLALGRGAVLPAHRQADGRGHADHLDRLPRAAARDVPAGSGVGDRRARPPDLRPRRHGEGVAVVLRQAAGPGDDASRSSACSSPPPRPTGSRDVLEAYERLMLDAMWGDHTLFTTAEGIERLWARSVDLLEDPPPVKPYAPGQLGPERDPPADRPARLAAAVRARLAREEVAVSTSCPGGGQAGSSCRAAATPARSAPIVVSSPWPVWTTVSSCSVSSRSRIDARM